MKVFYVFQFASWDLAFQMVPYARIDPNFAKQQMLLLLSERYMNYNGQVCGATRALSS